MLRETGVPIGPICETDDFRVLDYKILDGGESVQFYFVIEPREPQTKLNDDTFTKNGMTMFDKLGGRELLDRKGWNKHEDGSRYNSASTEINKINKGKFKGKIELVLKITNIKQE
ncbi:MAG: hypothetical protein Q7S66_00925 [bacterium]|nr:hypothetical protein [bacterium]